MKNSLLLLAGIALISLTENCSNSKKTAALQTTAGNAGSEMLYRFHWKLTEVQGNPVPFTSAAHLLFSPGQVNTVSGNSGCNRLSGSFTLTGGNSIKFAPLAITRMACMDNEANETERKFTEAISITNQWAITDTQLVLSNGNTIVAKLKGLQPLNADEKKLNGTWELNYISGAKIAFDGLFPGKKPTLVLNLPNTQASGNGSCNGFGCTIKINGSSISFGNIISTMMACEGGGEPVFFRTLEKVNRYSITGNNTLQLIMGDIAVLRFVRK